MFLQSKDPILAELIAKEEHRQQKHINLIASENIVSEAIKEATASVLTNKYAEGFVGNRYYGGCEHIDAIESLAQSRACSLFGSSFANVQPHSGSQANMAVYSALLQHGDTVLAQNLQAGGHLTHGSAVNFSGKMYHFSHYGVDQTTYCLDYDAIAKQAHSLKPKLIVAGTSSYPRTIDWQAFADIAKDCGAYLMVDMAHIAGLVATDLHPSPVPYAHVITSTTHKTLRGPRGGIILTNDASILEACNKAIFPGTQGGPLMNTIAAKAVGFLEASQPEFRIYTKKVLENAKAMAHTFAKLGACVVTGGTDTHMVLIDTIQSFGKTGHVCQQILEAQGIILNKNVLPFDIRTPKETSGIRLGTPWITTQGYTVDMCVELTKHIHSILTLHGAV
jgi:glycine hydroxymethyltransferase